MAEDFRSQALHRALRYGVPYVQRNGRHVTLVLSCGVQTVKTIGGGARESLRGHVQTVECPSSGMARSVERRVMRDLNAFPHRSSDVLRVSLLYAEAERRCACRQRRRAYEATA